MTPEISAALIGGLCGVIAAGVTSTLTAKGASATLLKAEKQNAQFLAVQVGPELKRFADDCLSVAFDNGRSLGQPSGENGECYATASAGELKLGEISDVAWRSLPIELMVDLFTFGDKQKAIEAKLAVDPYDDPPYYADFYAERQQDYAKLGIEAIELGIRLFKETGHTSKLPGAAEVKDQLAKRLHELQDLQARLAIYRASRPTSPFVP